MRVLLVNPPIYDFTAFDFWMRPYGMLRVAGCLREQASFSYFDFLESGSWDPWGRRPFTATRVSKPAAFADIPRHFSRFGRSREEFCTFLDRHPADVVLIQTSMTYWYPGVAEAIAAVRERQPKARIVLGGVYCRICPEHAKSLGADFVHETESLDPLWSFLGATPQEAPPLWDPCSRSAAVIKITKGCPFRCTYCSVPRFEPEFEARDRSRCLEELAHLRELGFRQVAFYDDSLLYRTESILLPFLEELRRRGWSFDFHTPNALNARWIDARIARAMVAAGFQEFFLGFESGNKDWQRKTGGKIYSEEFAQAVHRLREAGAKNLFAYLIVGHPEGEEQELEASIRFAQSLGVRVYLSEFSPIPGTPDGEKCRSGVDLNEPLHHNKTAFAIRRLGWERINRLKLLAKAGNPRGFAPATLQSARQPAPASAAPRY